jgi:type I restriction enzyme S subunit
LKEIEQRLSIVGDVEEQITKNEKRIQRLRQSILKKAFSGRLVLQIENQSPN